MGINTYTTIACDGPRCREDGGDDMGTKSNAERWARANGWTIGKYVLCPKCQTPEVRKELKVEQAEMDRIEEQMRQRRESEGR